LILFLHYFTLTPALSCFYIVGSDSIFSFPLDSPSHISSSSVTSHLHAPPPSPLYLPHTHTHIHTHTHTPTHTHTHTPLHTHTHTHTHRARGQHVESPDNRRVQVCECFHRPGAPMGADLEPRFGMSGGVVYRTEEVGIS
jgi:hypothetical protein